MLLFIIHRLSPHTYPDTFHVFSRLGEHNFRGKNPPKIAKSIQFIERIDIRYCYRHVSVNMAYIYDKQQHLNKMTNLPLMCAHSCMTGRINLIFTQKLDNKCRNTPAKLFCSNPFREKVTLFWLGGGGGGDLLFFSPVVAKYVWLKVNFRKCKTILFLWP